MNIIFQKWNEEFDRIYTLKTNTSYSSKLIQKMWCIEKKNYIFSAIF
jgi:hypothetical protein